MLKNQHGFVKNKFIVTNLINYSHYIPESLNEGKQVNAVYLDFPKAFDSVNHELLIFKLHNFGLEDGTLHWINSYLLNRELSVRIKGNVSDPFLANYEVPQGSHLGALLFILLLMTLLVVSNLLNFKFMRMTSKYITALIMLLTSFCYNRILIKFINGAFSIS